jgi:hypothetical protein
LFAWIRIHKNLDLDQVSVQKKSGLTALVIFSPIGKEINGLAGDTLYF